MRIEIAAEIKSIFYASDRKIAEAFLQAAIQKYAVSPPKLSVWSEENLIEGLWFLIFIPNILYLSGLPTACKG